MMSPSPHSSLAQQWAKKYVRNLVSTDQSRDGGAARRGLRGRAADKLLDSLRAVSLRAWAQTEEILGPEIQRHQIDRRLVNPWEISQDSFQIYEKALEFYASNTAYTQLPGWIGPDIKKVRQKYTETDPRIMAFVSMQFHYTGQLMMGQLSELERKVLGNCFKVIDDHLYMPLHRAYRAAAAYEFDSPTLLAVRSLMAESSDIAEVIVRKVTSMYPNYHSYSGSFESDVVRTSTLRDVEMFQTYLWVCVLEQNFSAIQDELFPLCVMIYPALKVHWELIMQMVHFLGQEIQGRLGADQLKLFVPYLMALREMFSSEVFDI